MTSIERKTGQHSDLIKEVLLAPLVVDRIQKSSASDVSVLDFGTGDASYLFHVINNINPQRSVENLAMVEADPSAFIKIWSDPPKTNRDIANIQVVDSCDRDVINQFMRVYEERFDFALSQLVAHQVMRDEELSYMLLCIFRLLRQNGSLCLVDLHPSYINYLQQNEPEKYQLAQDRSQDTGRYNFDQGGFVEMRNRPVAEVLSHALRIGFDLKNVESVHTDKIAHTGDRYRVLNERKTPMFYALDLSANKDNFVSSTDGVMSSIGIESNDYLRVKFMDNDSILVPIFNNWHTLHSGDKVVFHETYRKEVEKIALNYWVFPSGDPQKMWGGALLVSQK